MAADAKYGVVQVRRGVMGDAYVHWALPRIVGMANAAEVLLTGATFDGHDMQRLGIASRCLPNDEVLAAALATARDIAVNTAPLSVAFSKRLLCRARLDRARSAAGTELHHHLMGSDDAREGVMAFSNVDRSGADGVAGLARVAGRGWTRLRDDDRQRCSTVWT
jgi:enoyl-CoA hydratase/carnithine racemase